MGEFIHTAGVHDTVFDVSVERLARIYAKAVLDAAGGLPQQDALMQELESLQADVLDRHPRLTQLFDSKLVPDDEKLALLDRLFAGRATPLLMNVLKVMAAHGRLGLVSDMISSARKMWERRSGRIPVQLETANPLTPELEQEILSSLSRVLGADPVISARVNPDLIAGFVIRVGDRVYDSSVRTHLEETRRGMVARATEAIQSGQDRFFSSDARTNA
jgi:F-type H+-transporting ATPase subunit delta